MNKEKKHNKLVSELRFPEFEKDGDWEIRSIEKNIDMISGIALKGKELTEDYSGTPILRGINITEGHIRHSQKIDKFYLGDTTKINKYLVDENDIVIGMDGSKVGKNVALVSKFDVGSILIQRVARIRPIDSDIKYLYQNFISKRFITYVDNVNTSSGIPHISAKQIRDYEIGFPPKKEEQQKIANCLSSLDNVITAETEKLVHLKDHKKGLLQQLFPANGENKPQYRFPEFVEDGDWEEKRLDNIAKVVASGDLDTDKFSTDKTDKHIYPIYSNSVKDEGIYGFSTTFKYKGDSVSITARGTLGVAFYRLNEFVGIGRLLVVSDFKDIYPIFFKENWNYFAKIDLENGGIPQLTAIKARLTILQYPKPKEQQKIANCLSSVDDLIQSQIEKIETLKAHKKGLMQQLFPNVNDVAV